MFTQPPTTHPGIHTLPMHGEPCCVSAKPADADEQDRRDMVRLAAGHGAALNDLMERHAERIFQYLVRSLQNEEDAADLAQETFVRVYQNRTKFDAGKRFSTWLYAIASNLVRDRYRWRGRHQQVSLDAENAITGNTFGESLPEQKPSPVETAQAEERAQTVRRAVAALPEKWRVPLVLAEYEEKSHAEIGEIIGCSAKAVEVRIYKARQQLRASLSHLMEATGTQRRTTNAGGIRGGKQAQSTYYEHEL